MTLIATACSVVTLSFGIAAAIRKDSPGHSVAASKGVTGWPSACPKLDVSAVSNNDPNPELMRRIAEISSLKEQIEHTVDSLVARHGETSDSVAPAKALAASVTALKRELLKQYLECCIAEAERATNSSNN